MTSDCRVQMTLLFQIVGIISMNVSAAGHSTLEHFWYFQAFLLRREAIFHDNKEIIRKINV